MKGRFHGVVKSDLSIDKHQIRFLPVTLLLLQSFFTLTCVIAGLASTATHIMKVPPEMNIKPGTFK